MGHLSYMYSLSQVLRRVRKIAKSYYHLRHVYPLGTTGLPPGGFL